MSEETKTRNPIIVFYVNVDNLEHHYAAEITNKVGKEMKKLLKDDHYYQIVVPVKGTNSKIEFLNPSVISEETQESVNKKIETMKEHIDSYLLDAKNCEV